MELGAQIKAIREHYGYTITHVSLQTGIAKETIRRIETDKFEPKLSTLDILSDFYRIDLIELLARKRGITSLFSQELISKTNGHINSFDYQALKKFASETIELLKVEDNSHKSVLIGFLESLKGIKYNSEDSRQDSISTLESILLQLNPQYHTKLSKNFPLPIEVSSIILLSVLYRQTNQLEKAVALIENTLYKLKKLPYLNDRYVNFIATLYLNLAYTYHYQNEHVKVIETVDEALRDPSLAHTGEVVFNFLFRKGIAMFKLDDKDYYSVLTSAMLVIEVERRKMICNILKDNYDITHHFTTNY
jgi:transcriptional regulator with XRE-family HTH domain